MLTEIDNEHRQKMSFFAGITFKLEGMILGGCFSRVLTKCFLNICRLFCFSCIILVIKNIITSRGNISAYDGALQQVESNRQFPTEEISSRGSLIIPSIRRDAGPLPHKLVATKSFTAPSSCAKLGNRTKHITSSSAASFQWEDGSGHVLEVTNFRVDRSKNSVSEYSSILVREKRNQTEISEKINLPAAADAEDPRTFFWKGSPVVIFVAAKGDLRQMWLYHYGRKHGVVLTICGHNIERREKNWTPLVVDDGKTFLLVYSIDPLVILQYDIDAGDGVCNLIFGHLPVHKMKAPYGGTPFKEISIPTDIRGVKARSFISFAHSRHATVPQKRTGRRVYRPVPLILHMFCPSTVSAWLDGCTFGIDVYDIFHEMESPVDVFESKFVMNRSLSVSYPYDLHVFQESEIVRIGIGYEDCASVYEDLQIDFETIKNGQLQHPIRLELENKLNNEVTFIAEAQPVSMKCPYPRHIHKRFDGYVYDTAIRSPIASKEEELTKCIEGKIWVVSHEGVAPERFRSMIKEEPCKRITSGMKKRPAMGVLAHFPYPFSLDLQHAPKLCIYIYGSVYESILSQLRRHPDNSMKLHNDDAYFKFATLDELLLHPDQDPIGIQYQFESFLTANVTYPIILAKLDTFHSLSSLQKLGSLVSDITGIQHNFTSMFIKGYHSASSIASISNLTLKEQFVERYSQLNDMFTSMPLIHLKQGN